MVRAGFGSIVLAAGLIAFVAPAAPSGAQPAQATPADAAPFVGEWTLSLQGPNGPGTFDLTITVEKEKVAAEIANANMAASPIADITRAEKTLVLRYTFMYEGNPVDAAVSLTPGADGKVNAQIDFAGGAYTMTGTAAKKEKKE